MLDTFHQTTILGWPLSNIVYLLTLCLVVIVGGVTQAGEGLFGPLRREVARRAFKPAVQACQIVPGKLGGLAGVYGAARAFIDQREQGIV